MVHKWIENIIIRKVYIFRHKEGNYSKNIKKRTDKCHKLYTQNNDIFALIKLSPTWTCLSLNKKQTTWRNKNDQPKNHESASFSNGKTNTMVRIKYSTHKVNTYH